MNCQDIARILDDQRIGELAEADRQAARSHLAECAECASDWHVHEQVSAEAIPPVPPELRAQFAAQVAGRAGPGARRESRLILIGTIVAVAAAAATLAVQLARPPGTDVAAAPTALPAVAAGVDTGNPQQPAELPVEQDAPGDAGRPAVPEVKAVAASAPPPARFTLLLLPTRHESPDEAAESAVESFREALLEAFAEEPDIAIVAAQAGRAPEGVEPTHRLTILSPNYNEMSSGGRMFFAGDGRGSWGGSGPSPGTGPRWAVEVMIDPESGSSSKALYVRTTLGGLGKPANETCNMSGFESIGVPVPSNFERMRRACASPQQMAATLAEELRRPVPTPAQQMAAMLARLRDSSLQYMERQQALRQLLQEARQNGVDVDAQVIAAVADFVPTLAPDQRALIWSSVQFADQPGFIDLLVDAVRIDPDPAVRQAALLALASGYGHDDRVRAALEGVAQQDSSELLRMAARSRLPGDNSWQTYVVQTLGKAELAPEARVEPFMMAARLAVGPAGANQLQALLATDGVVRQLGELFRAMHAETRPPGPFERFDQSSSDNAMQTIQSLVQLVDQSAATDLNILVVTDKPRPYSGITTQALASLAGQRDVPRVARVLEDIAAGKHGPEMMQMLEEIRARAPPGGAFGRSPPPPPPPPPVPGLSR